MFWTRPPFIKKFSNICDYLRILYYIFVSESKTNSKKAIRYVLDYFFNPLKLSSMRIKTIFKVISSDLMQEILLYYYRSFSG